MSQFKGQHPVIEIASSVVGSTVIVTNIILLMTMIRTPRLHTRTNAFVSSHSVADLLLGMVSMVPRLAYFVGSSWVYDNKYPCLIFICILYASILQSITCLTIVSADRYIFIVHPFVYDRWMTENTTAVLIGFSWIFAFLVGFYPLVNNNYSGTCWPFDIFPLHFYLFFHPFTFFCSIAMFIMYGRIVGVRNKLVRDTYSRSDRSNWKVVRFLILVCGLFVLCWAPTFIIDVIRFTTGLQWKVATIAAFSLIISHSGVNFFALFFMNSRFRHSVIRMMCPSNIRMCFDEVRQSISTKNALYVCANMCTNESLDTRSISTTWGSKHISDKTSSIRNAIEPNADKIADEMKAPSTIVGEISNDSTGVHTKAISQTEIRRLMELYTTKTTDSNISIGNVDTPSPKAENNLRVSVELPKESIIH